MKKINSTLCLLLVVHFAAIAQQLDALSPEQVQRINQLFVSFDADDTPGYAIAVFYKDQALFQRGYGMANLDYNIPISPKSVFNVASLSKQFTGACIAQLILDGKLSLEENVADYFPALKKYPRAIKIKHLVYMTSGLKEYYTLPRANGLSWDPVEYLYDRYCHCCFA